jgi:hypothetical protein
MTMTTMGPVFERIVAEYREMPGVSLTVAQAGRLFGLASDQCITETLAEFQVIQVSLDSDNGETLKRIGKAVQVEKVFRQFSASVRWRRAEPRLTCRGSG